MTTASKYIIQRKLSIVDLAATLGNISDACRKLGVSRQHYYDIKGAIEQDGLEGLLEKTRKSPRLANRIPLAIEEAVLAYSLESPAHGSVRASNELKKIGTDVSPNGIRCIWMRHKLTKRKNRLERLSTWAAAEGRILTESQVQALEAAKDEKEALGEIETHHPGFVVGQDTFYVGYIKGVGKIYQQTGIDVFSNVGFAKLYTEKTAVTAADFVNDKILPFFDAHGMRVIRILTDRGSEYCGVRENHAFELFLHLTDIEHAKTRVKRPQSNGSTERLNQTILDEFYAVAFRKKHYKTLAEIQADLDDFMQTYNEKRTNQGKRCQGRTPLETFTSNIDLYHRYVHEGLEAGQLLN